MATIYLKNVSRRYGQRSVLDGLTLTVNHGECFTLLGPSGCGKTVLLRLIAGFEQPTAGSIRIGDALVADASAHVPPDRRDLGVVFQEYAVWPHMSVFDNVGYPLKLAKTPKEERADRVMETIALVNLHSLEKRLPSELSGGQQQRVALARALVGKPSLMLLDEPLSNLDANLREEMRFEIKELQRKLNITVMYVTHDQEIALAISDRIAVMDTQGRIRQIGSPEDIFEKPVDSFVFSFMGVANFLQVRREGNKFFVGKGGQRAPWDRPHGDSLAWVAAFRPSDVVIRRDGNGLKGRVKRASFLGPVMDYLVEIDGAHLRTTVDTHTAVANNLMFDDDQPCVVGVREVHWFDADTIQSAGEAWA
ncbi:MAG: ABC transporter ATP-binding protein [Desulfovibrio sp.]|jgi:iron(III) transport system ATP-binding protein|nr:ABC transporter ATP-binding protein [Desulfovibrio sp.]